MRLKICLIIGAAILSCGFQQVSAAKVAVNSRLVYYCNADTLKKDTSAKKNNFDDLVKFMSRNIRFPRVAFDKHLPGYAILGFDVNDKGEMSNLHIARTMEEGDFGQATMDAAGKYKGTVKAAPGQYDLLVLFRFKDDQYPGDKQIPFKMFAGTVYVIGWSQIVTR